MTGCRKYGADAFAKERHEAKVRPRIDGRTWTYDEQQLRDEWSPEQISGWMKKNLEIYISHEWIFQHLLKDKLVGGSLHFYLRCKQKRKKRYGSYDRLGNFKNRVSIDDHPNIFEARSRIGDWVADTIIGKAHKQTIVSLTDRKSGLALICKVDRRTKGNTEGAIKRLLASISNQIHTITSDNGKEFANYEQIAKRLKINFYFAHPYSIWRRGANENTNGLIHHYFPKIRDNRNIKDKELIHTLNT